MNGQSCVFEKSVKSQLACLIRIQTSSETSRTRLKSFTEGPNVYTTAKSVPNWLNGHTQRVRKLDPRRQVVPRNTEA